ncbi:MAG: hypothetical protein WCH10_01480 [bacterium]
MSIAIKINEELYNAAKPIAQAQYRSVPNQIAYWAKIGRAAIDNPDLPVEFIIKIFEGLADVDAGRVEPYTKGEFSANKQN